MRQGTVYLVGAGPGDVGLFTLRGRRLLELADVVVYDALVGQGVLSLIPPETVRIDVGKHAGNHPVKQEEINQILLEQAQSGKQVVRLKGGDPFLFGRGGEELELLAENGIGYEVVPGVTSAIAVPAYGGIPVTHRDFCSSVHIITGHTRGGGQGEPDYAALARMKGTLIFLMGVAALGRICAGLQAAGMPGQTPAAILEQGTGAGQRKVLAQLDTLPARAAAENIAAPAVIVVGAVCSLAPRFEWAEKRPLGGKRIVVTRPRDRAFALSQLLRDSGAEVIELPCIRTAAVEDNRRLDQALARLGDYRWAVFTSPAGVKHLMDHLRGERFDLRRLYGVKLAALGAATGAELLRHGLMTDLVPDPYSAAALGELLGRTAAPGERALILRARAGSPDLTVALDRWGVSYDDVPIYDTSFACENAQAVGVLLDAGQLDYLAFTSASTVHGLVSALGRERAYGKTTAVCIGPTTAKAARAYGMRVMIAREATIESLAAEMIAGQAQDKPEE